LWTYLDGSQRLKDFIQSRPSQLVWPHDALKKPLVIDDLNLKNKCDDLRHKIKYTYVHGQLQVSVGLEKHNRS
jgi:hypothetical protein